MVLNITFQGNIVDENDNPIDCYYKLFHVQSEKWSDTRVSSYSQYNINLGDDDVLGIYGSTPSTTDVVLVFWQGSENITELQDRFSIIRLVHTNQNVHLNNVQLRPKTAPNLVVTVNNDYLIKEKTSLELSYDNDYSYEYDGMIHLHRDSYFGEQIFPDTVFTESYVWESDKTSVAWHYYDDPGRYDVIVEIENDHGKITKQTVEVRVTYRPPVGSIMISPNVPYLNETLSMSFSYTDIDGAFKSIKNYFDTSIVYEFPKEDVEHSVTFTYEYQLTEIKDWLVTQSIEYEVGIDDEVEFIDIERIVVMGNWPPVIDKLSYEEKNYKQYINLGYHDDDDLIVSCTLEINQQHPMTGEYGLYYFMDDVMGLEEIEVNVPTGLYKFKVIVTDERGASTEQELEHEIMCGSDFYSKKGRNSYDGE